METLSHEFIENIPRELQQGVLYISGKHRTAIHSCICGCGNEVVTRFSPKDWELKYDGETVSLNPSIGNWSFPCRSHYWIVKSEIIHARNWTLSEIQENRKKDKVNKKVLYPDPKFEKLTKDVIKPKSIIQKLFEFFRF